MVDQGNNMSDLWKRLRFVFIAILVYRIGTHIPIPGIDPDRLAALFEQNQGTIIEMFNLFSGGALERMSIFALNVVPYISSAIIMQLFSNSIPYLQELKKDGQAGRNAITQYTRYGTAVLAFIQASALAVTLSASGLAYVPGPSFNNYCDKYFNWHTRSNRTGSRAIKTRRSQYFITHRHWIIVYGSNCSSCFH
jgi:preprotein translocase subunit SecY